MRERESEKEEDLFQSQCGCHRSAPISINWWSFLFFFCDALYTLFTLRLHNNEWLWKRLAHYVHMPMQICVRLFATNITRSIVLNRLEVQSMQANSNTSQQTSETIIVWLSVCMHLVRRDGKISIKFANSYTYIFIWFIYQTLCSNVITKSKYVRSISEQYKLSLDRISMIKQFN